MAKRYIKVGSLLSKSLQLASVSTAIFDWSKLLEEFLWYNDSQKGFLKSFMLIVLKSLKSLIHERFSSLYIKRTNLPIFNAKFLSNARCRNMSHHLYFKPMCKIVLYIQVSVFVYMYVCEMIVYFQHCLWKTNHL